MGKGTLSILLSIELGNVTSIVIDTSFFLILGMWIT